MQPGGGGPGPEAPGAAAGAPPAAGPARTASAPPLWALPGMDLSPVLSPRQQALAQTVAARLRSRRGPGRAQAPREGAATDSREALRGGPADANSSSTVIDDDLGSAVQSKLTTHQAQRGFFVRIVAQRELEVSEDKWIEVLARHAAQGLNRITGSKLRSARTGGASTLTAPDMSEEALIRQTRFRWPLAEVMSPYSLLYMAWTYFMMAVSAPDPSAERRREARQHAGPGTDAPREG